MARDFRSSRNSTLKTIAEKRMVDDAPINITFDKLKEHPDNEYLFGMTDIEQMAQGIKENGFKGAIEVWDLKDGTYMIYSGHRRKRGAELAGMESIKAFVYPYPESEAQRRRELIGANLYSRYNAVKAEDPIHTARQIAYHRITIELERKEGIYKGDSDTRTQLASDFSISAASVYRYESLLNLTTELQQKVIEKEIQFGQASSMAAMSEDKQEKCWNAICEYKENSGEDSISRETTQKFIDYVKNVDDDEVEDISTNDIIEEVFPKEPEPETQVEIPEETEEEVTIKDTKNTEDVETEEIKETFPVHGEQNKHVKVSSDEAEKEEEPVLDDGWGNGEEETDETVNVNEDEEENDTNNDDDDKHFTEFMVSYNKIEEILSQKFDFNNDKKNIVIEKLEKLKELIETEKERLED